MATPIALLAGLAWAVSPTIAVHSLEPPAAIATPDTAIAPSLPVYHIVLIDLLDTTTETEIAALIADSNATIAGIPGVLAVDTGRKALGDRAVHISDYDLAVYVQFESIDALAAYGPHPDHQAFLDRHRHLWSGIRVIDFFGSIDPGETPDGIEEITP